MGRGRVDPAPPAPINSDPKERKRGGQTEKREDGRKRGGNRERETNWVERETTETEKHKKTGEYRLGN
jgi:hypothetical protein